MAGLRGKGSRASEGRREVGVKTEYAKGRKTEKKSSNMMRMTGRGLGRGINRKK